MGHEVSTLISYQEENNRSNNHNNNCNSNIGNKGTTQYGIIRIKPRHRRQKRRQHHHDASPSCCGTIISSSSPSSLPKNLTLIMIAVASASKVAAGGGNSPPSCCFAAHPPAAVAATRTFSRGGVLAGLPFSSSSSSSISTTARTRTTSSSSSTTALSVSSIPSLSTLLAPLASVAMTNMHAVSNNRRVTMGGITTATASSSSMATLAAAVVPPPGSRLARLKNKNKGRTSTSSRTDLRYTMTNSGASGYSPYEEQQQLELRKNLFSLGNNKSNVEIGRANDENDSDDGGAGGAKKASVTMEGNKEEPNHDFGSAMIDSTNQNYNRINGKHGNHTTTDPTSNNKINVNNNIYAKRGKRARMARFINTRFSRRLSSSQSTAMANDNTASDVTTNTNNNNNNKKKTKLSSSSSLTEEEYQKRKAAWAAKYTSVSTLRTTFGTNKNRLWGDFDPKTTRQLYHTLLPRALLGLHDMGLSKVDELAPLAYQARVAAKKYARERSMLPGRIGSMLYDGFRQWKRYGKFDHRGMTWEQVWRKYEDQVLKEVMEEIAREEEEEEEHEAAVAALRQVTSATEQALLDYADALDDEELTARICLRILERSVVTNEAIDKLFLKRIMNGEEEEYDDEDEEDFEQADYLSDSDKLSLSSNMSSISASSATKKGRKQARQERQRRRKLRIQADLRAIEKKFDHDIQALLLSGGGMDSSANKDVREGSNNKMRRRRRSSFFWSKSSSSFTSRRKSGVTANEDVDDAPSLNMDGESAAAFARGGAETAMESFGSLDQPPTELEIAAAIISMTEDPASIDFEYDSEDLGTTSDANDSVHKSSSFALNDEDTSATITATSTNTTTNQRKKLFRKLSVHEVFALRILATTKHRIASLHSLSNFNGDKKEEEDDDEDLKF